jgi:hypothetical protein
VFIGALSGVSLLASSALIASGVGGIRSSGAASKTRSTTISSPGVWTLERLGYGAQQVPVDHSLNVIHLGFQLPPGVAAAAVRCYDARAQAPRTCFLIHYHFKIRFDPATQPGFVYVSAATNRFTSSQVPFKATTPEGKLTIEWSTLDLIRGYDAHTSYTPEIEVQNVNYLQTRGLRDGENTLDLQLEIPGPAVVSSLEVLPDTGLEWNHEPPGRLALSLKPRALKARVGKIIHVIYSVKRVGGRAPENVKVEAVGDPRRLKPVGAVLRRLPVVRGIVRGRFAFRVRRPGRTRVGVHVASGTTNNTVFVRLRATRK